MAATPRSEEHTSELQSHSEISYAVFCYASRAKLVEGAITRLGVAAKDAERVVGEMYRNREQYVRRHFNREWRDVTNYQLCIDTGWLGLDGAAELIVELVRKELNAT